MSVNKTSLNITDGNRNEHPLLTEVNNDVSASSPSLMLAAVWK